MLRAPSSVLVALSLAAAGCGKPAAKADPGQKAVAADTERVAVPGARGADVPPPSMRMGGGDEGMATAGPTVGAAGGAAAGEDPFKLKPEEGTLNIEVPAEAAAGTEVVARVNVVPVGPYKINKEFPTKLELETPAGVTLAKAKLTAGGHDGAKGDADAFEDKQLTFSVRLTPAQSGAHTISGTFKFAVCDKDTCLAKKEQIRIAVAAK